MEKFFNYIKQHKQRALAREIGVTDQHLSRIMTGHRRLCLPVVCRLIKHSGGKLFLTADDVENFTGGKTFFFNKVGEGKKNENTTAFAE